VGRDGPHPLGHGRDRNERAGEIGQEQQREAAAEAELAATEALRRATQRRAGELEKREGRLRAARDRAKAAAKLAARQGSM
jgi:hypothetical protein